jgi:hypothetical protein
MYKYYRSWKRYGGDNYIAPLPGLPGIQGVTADSIAIGAAIEAAGDSLRDNKQEQDHPKS